MKTIRNLCIFLSAVAGYAEPVFEETLVNMPPTSQQVEEVAPHSDLGSAVTKMVLTLFGLVILFGLSYWMLKRLGKTRMKGMNHYKAIKIREKRPISPKTSLYLIELAGKEILIAESQLDVRPLATYEWPDEEPKG